MHFVVLKTGNNKHTQKQYLQFPFPKYILLSSPFQISIKLNIDLFILKESFRKEEIIYICSDGNRLFSTLLVATLKIIMLGQTAGASLNQFLQGIKKIIQEGIFNMWVNSSGVLISAKTVQVLNFLLNF